MSDYKAALAKALAKSIDKSNVVGVLTVRGLPSRQLQIMKQKLPATITMARKNLLVRAIKASKKEGIDKLLDFVQDQPALILSEENPFTLYAQITKSKAPAPAKPGDVVPHDVVVEAGETSFPPGPVLGELKSAGLPAAVENGKIVIKETTTLLDAGGEVTDKLADVFAKLGIEPMEIGLDLVACYENGLVFGRDVLYVDEEKYFNDFVGAYRHALNLSVETAFPTGNNVHILLANAFQDAKGVSIEAGILNPATVGEILGRAARAAKSVSSQVGPEVPAKEAKTGDTRGEEATPEKKAEGNGEEKQAGAPAPGEKPAEGVNEKAPAEGTGRDTPAAGAESQSSTDDKKEE